MFSRLMQKYWGLFLLAWGGTVVYNVPFLRYMMYEPIQNALQLSHTQMGNMMGVYGLAALVSYWPGGWMADRISPRYLLSISYLASGLVGIWFAAFPSYGACLFIHAVWGVATSLTFWPALLKATNDLAPREELGRFYGLLESGRGILTILTVYFGIWIFSFYDDQVRGMSMVINILNAFCLAAVPMTWFWFKDPTELKPNPSLAKDIVTVIKSPWIWCVSLIVLSTYSSLVLGTYFTPYMTEILGISTVTIGFLSTFWIYGSQFLAAPLGGIVSDKLGARPAVMMILFGILMLIAAVAVIAPATASMFILMVILAAGLYCSIYAIRGIYFAVLEDLQVSPAIIGSALGFASLVGFAPDAFLYPAAGMILDAYPGVAGYKILFTLTGVAGTLGLAMSLAIMIKVKALRKAAA